jgi:hypothetical protein
VEPGMKMAHHGITLPPKLLDARLSSYSRQFKHDPSYPRFCLFGCRPTRQPPYR